MKQIKIFSEDSPAMLKQKNTSSQLSLGSYPSTSNSLTEDIILDNQHSEILVCDVYTTLVNDFKSSIDNSPQETSKTKAISVIKNQTFHTVNTDDSENSSEEKGSGRKDRKPLPLIFNQSHYGCSDSYDSSSEASEGTKKTCKCVYLGEKETLTSFWDKCLYQCFKSKRCVAGEKPKRKYRKKLKTLKASSKKRKHLNVPLSCIDTKGVAVMQTGW